MYSICSFAHAYRLRYVTQKSINVECWREVVQGNLHPVGWSCNHNIPLSVPLDLADHLKDDDCQKEAMEEVAKAEMEGVSVAEEALEVDGYTAVDRIKQGMKVEVDWVGLCFVIYGIQGAVMCMSA